MDDDRFDRWARAIAEGLASRRHLMRRAGATAFVAGLSGLGGDVAEGKGKKKKKKGKKGKKKKKVTGQCPANGQICDFPWQHCGAQGLTCGCGARSDGSPFCGDCPVCIPGGCTSDEDCVDNWGLPAGTICTSAAGGDCGCMTDVCLTPCGTCQDCNCVP
jgi:hypothetical protein